MRAKFKREEARSLGLLYVSDQVVDPFSSSFTAKTYFCLHILPAIFETAKWLAMSKVIP